MDVRIWKYCLEITDLQRVEMPPGAQILSIGNQNDTVCLWSIADVSTKFWQQRWFEVIGTGNRLNMNFGIERKFIGTVQINAFVWHVFERLN